MLLNKETNQIRINNIFFKIDEKNIKNCGSRTLGIMNASSLPLLPGSLWTIEVIFLRVLSIHQKDLKIICIGRLFFYSISTFEGYIMPNPLYTYI